MFVFHKANDKDKDDNKVIITPCIGQNDMDKDVIFQQAQQLFQNNEFDNSLLIISQVVQADPGNPDYLFFRGKVHRHLCNFQSALLDINTCLNKNENIEYELEKSIILTEMREFSMAESLLNKIIRHNPKIFLAVVTRGEIFRITKKYELAISDFNLALELSNNDSHVLVGRGEALLAIKNYFKAQQDFISALAVSPNDAWCHYQLGLCYFLQGQPELFEDQLSLAKNILKNAIKAGLRSRRNIMNLALFNLAVENYAESIPSYLEFAKENTCIPLFFEAIDDVDFLIENIHVTSESFKERCVYVKGALWHAANKDY